MIKLLDGKLPDFPLSAGLVRIQSLYRSYGTSFDFLRFYYQIVDDKITAIMSIMDGNATLVDNNADYEEIIDFLEVIGAETVYSEGKLPLEIIDNGYIVKKSVAPIEVLSNNCNLTIVYDIMSTSFQLPDFNAWYPDMSHRIRHDGAVAILNDNGAAIGLKGDNGALISGICVSENFRKKGLGSSILKELIDNLSVGEIFALVDINGPISFYTKNGFSIVSEFSTYKVK
ncbi:MAG: GNAT family N-acetyltransferase [Clostridia bacterium]|nr:GNAT family N-acetyltransferase [Clostridia bacterium]